MCSNQSSTGVKSRYIMFEMRASPLDPGPFRVAVDLYAGELSLGEAVLTDAQPSAAFPLLLPSGARQLGLTAMGETGRARLDDVRVAPDGNVRLLSSAPRFSP